MITNEIHQALVDISAEQGWNEESQIIHLCGFLSYISSRHDLQQTEEGLLAAFRKYLQDLADEENSEAEELYEQYVADEEHNAKYCDACRITGHEQCSMTPGCPCCDRTAYHGLTGE